MNGQFPPLFYDGEIYPTICNVRFDISFILFVLILFSLSFRLFPSLLPLVLTTKIVFRLALYQWHCLAPVTRAWRVGIELFFKLPLAYHLSQYYQIDFFFTSFATYEIFPPFDFSFLLLDCLLLRYDGASDSEMRMFLVTCLRFMRLDIVFI